MSERSCQGFIGCSHATPPIGHFRQLINQDHQVSDFRNILQESLRLVVKVFLERMGMEKEIFLWS